MSAPNGHANEIDGPASSAAPAPVFTLGQFTAEEIRKLTAELEIPFDPSVVEWRVTNTSNNGKRGQMMPYADPRAYSDRLNRLVTPAGWTRAYAVQTSAVVQRDKNRGPAAKVLVTCDLKIIGVGSKSGTGEEWSDNENALTAAGWGRGLGAKGREKEKSGDSYGNGHASNGQAASPGNNGNHPNLSEEIERMERKIGKRMYRSLLKRVARVWSPRKIHDAAIG